MITLSEKQNEYIRNANARWNFKIGAVRSGKSFVDVVQTIPRRIIERRGKSGLNVILGVSRDTIERNVLQPMREQYGSEIVGTISNKNIARIRGEAVYCLGAEKINQVAKILGSSIKYCYGDEIAKWNSEVFEVLKSRLDKQYSCFDGACNPESPKHWLKAFIDDESIDSYVQHYTIWDNPFLPKEFVENLCTEYEGTVYYGRYIRGDWVQAEGLVFPRFEDALVDEIPDTPVMEYGISLDYGTQNPFAGILWERHGQVWYGVDELYYSGRDTGIQKTDGDYLQMLLEFARPAIDYYQKKKQEGMYGSVYVEPVQVVIDPSAASMIALLERAKEFRVIHADNSVLEGIRNTNLAIQRESFKIHRRCKNWLDEVQGYVWDDNAEEDKPIKESDHLQDACRYWIQTKRLAETHEQYTSIFRRRI